MQALNKTTIKKVAVRAAAVSAVFLGAQQFALAADELKVSVSKSTTEAVFAKIKEPFEKETGIKLTYFKTTPRYGNVTDSADYVQDLMDGKVDAAVAAGTFQYMENGFKNRKEKMTPDITHRVIGHDTMQVLVNKQANVSKATLEQLSDIFTGKVTNWKQVGGADVPVTIFLYASKTGKNASFKKLVMKDAPFGGTVKDTPGEEEDYVKEIAATPGGIGFRSLTFPVGDKVIQMETPVVGRPITMFTKGQPSPNMQKLINFVRDYGSKTK